MNIGFCYGGKEDKIAGVNRVILETISRIIEKNKENIYFSLEDNYLHFPINAIDTVSGSVVLDRNNGKTIVDYRKIQCYLKDIDIIHSFYNTIHTIDYNCKKIITVHDLIPLIHPEWFAGRASYDYFDVAIRKSCQIADVIMAVSQSTKNDIVEYYRVPEEKVQVIYPGLFSDLNFEKCNKDIVKKYELKDEYMLSVGTLEPRKNLRGVIRGFIHFKEMHPNSKLKLVLTGKVGWDFEFEQFIESIGRYKEDLILTGYVSDEELAGLYVNALAVAYVSFYEGFGLPILEAMAAGKAVICSNTTSMPEVGGDSVIYCNPYEDESITDAIERIIFNEGLRKTIEINAKKRAEMFSYEKTANAVLKLYDDLVKK